VLTVGVLPELTAELTMGVGDAVPTSNSRVVLGVLPELGDDVGLTVAGSADGVSVTDSSSSGGEAQTLGA
jgi:hypothetical protein